MSDAKNAYQFPRIVWVSDTAAGGEYVRAYFEPGALGDRSPFLLVPQRPEMLAQAARFYERPVE